MTAILYAYPETESQSAPVSMSFNARTRDLTVSVGQSVGLSDLVLQWRCEHVQGTGFAMPGATDAQLIAFAGAKICGECDWTIERCAPASTAEN